ncbi:FCRL1 protein, partial [Acrocephalus arundinaceus]|nr:FCRL1 protein [Acrocephalus arundinaceus]
LQLHHSGHYHCGGWVSFGLTQEWKESSPVTVTVHGVLLSEVSLWVWPPGGQVALGDHQVLSCTVAKGTGPLSFTWHWGGSGTLLGPSPYRELCHTGDSDS